MAKGKFRISKEKCQAVVTEYESYGLPALQDVTSYAGTKGLSVSYVGDLFDEVRRALKRGDLTTTSEVMEFFLRTSKREALTLDRAKAGNIITK